MSNADVITEKVYCSGYPNCNNSNDAAMWAMNNNQWMNNPFAYMMMLGMMRWMYGDNWQNRAGSDTEINSRFNQLSGQLSDNHNTDIINEAVKGNTTRIGELANNLNVDIRAIQTGICDVRSGIQQVAGDVRFSSERIINAAERGDASIVSKLMECCCQNKQLVQQMGYEGQIRDLQNTSAIQGRIDQLSNGVQQGFSSTAYASQQQTCNIIDAINASQQRTADLLNNHWKDELALQLQDEKFKNSQLQQNIYMRDLIEKGNGCGCGC